MTALLTTAGAFTVITHPVRGNATHTVHIVVEPARLEMAVEHLLAVALRPMSTGWMTGGMVAGDSGVEWGEQAVPGERVAVHVDVNLDVWKAGCDGRTPGALVRYVASIAAPCDRYAAATGEITTAEDWSISTF